MLRLMNHFRWGQICSPICFKFCNHSFETIFCGECSIPFRGTSKQRCHSRCCSFDQTSFGFKAWFTFDGLQVIAEDHISSYLHMQVNQHLPNSDSFCKFLFQVKNNTVIFHLELSRFMLWRNPPTSSSKLYLLLLWNWNTTSNKPDLCNKIMYVLFRLFGKYIQSSKCSWYIFAGAKLSVIGTHLLALHMCIWRRGGLCSHC